jgi:serine/threonine protein kinase
VRLWIKLFRLSETADVCAKLADFGLSREAASTMAGSLPTWRWASPEAICGTKFDERSDVYSLAIVMWELVTCGCPFEEFTPEGERNCFAVKDAIVEGSLRPTIPPECPEGLASLIRMCWQGKPEDRPGLELVVEQLSSMLGVSGESDCPTPRGSNLSINSEFPVKSPVVDHELMRQKKFLSLVQTVNTHQANPVCLALIESTCTVAVGYKTGLVSIHVYHVSSKKKNSSSSIRASSEEKIQKFSPFLKKPKFIVCRYPDSLILIGITCWDFRFFFACF